MGLAERFRQGCELYAAGRLDQAEALFRELLAQHPDQPDLLNALAIVLDATGRTDQAVVLIRKACDLNPGCGAYHYNLGNLLRKNSTTEEAEQEYLLAVEADPNLARACQGLGSLYLEGGRLAEAEAALEKAVQLEPRQVEALHDLGRLRLQQGRIVEAEQCCRSCLEYDAAFLPAMNELGMLLLRRNRLDEAKEWFEKALQLDPGYLQARCNGAVLATWQGELQQAIDELQQICLLAPDDGNIHFNLALALLADGRMEQGWQQYEWRFRKSNPVQQRHAGLPRWHGEPLIGKTLLVHAEQGYGDSLQFVRYLPQLAAYGATVLLEAQDQNIAPLLATVEGVSACFSREEYSPLAVDYQIPMMSLPLVLGTAGWPPPTEPYLHPPSAQMEVWHNRLAQLPGLKVGLAWAGRPEHENDANRSLPPAALDPLQTIGGVSWVSLQFKGGNSLDLPLQLYDFSSEIEDFSDSAALVAGLDLVITIDSAVAHLAGALGRPVLLLLPWNADWRWQKQRDDSPWYPGMRLYRQAVAGLWDPLITAIIRDLANWSLIPGQGVVIAGGIQEMKRDYTELNRFLDRIEADVYPEAPSQIHGQITRKALEQLEGLYPVSPGMRVLDVGCGQGPALEFFRERQAVYLGVTLSDEDVEACRGKGFNVQRMDQSFLELPDQSHDLLWARHVIEHSVFPLFTLYGFNRVLCPGGMMYLEVPAPETSCHHEHNPNHYSVLTKLGWRSLLERSGFRIQADVDYSFDVIAGPDLYWGFYCRK